MSVELVKDLLDEHPEVVRVHLASPNDDGVVSDVGGIRHLIRRRRIPLIVVEAHGPHFRFHADLPLSAVSIGADLIVHSTHKTQLALTQASLLHLNDNGDPINRAPVSRILSLLQSTSPCSILLASLDAAPRNQMAMAGHHHFTRVIRLAHLARRSICEMKGLRCHGNEDLIDSWKESLLSIS